MILLFTAMLIGLTSVTAAEHNSAKKVKDLDLTSRYRYTQPIMFVERGVEFLIFTDGSFDFNTDVFSNSPRRGNFYQRNRRGGPNRSFGAPGTQYRHFGSRGVRVTHDYLGRVRRIGNVFINYDRQGRVKRVGTVYMRYRHGLLQRVGNLRLLYNRRGRIIGYTGQVNFSNPYCGLDFGNGINNNWNNDQWDDDDWNNNDDDFYYYRENGKIKRRSRD